MTSARAVFTATSLRFAHALVPDELHGTDGFIERGIVAGRPRELEL